MGCDVRAEPNQSVTKLGTYPPLELSRNPNSRAAAVMMQEFARSGVAHACISPGARSTAIVTGPLRARRVRPWVILDERSAGFFALGMARETRRPVIRVCTSGTAAANYLPAVVESFPVQDSADRHHRRPSARGARLPLRTDHRPGQDVR